MSRDQQAIQDLHEAFTSVTGQVLHLTIRRMDAYEAFLAHGLTVADLHLVVNNRCRIAQQKGGEPYLRFHSLIERPEDFEEELQAIKARRRQKVMDRNKSKALQATGRTGQVPLPKPRQVGDVMKGKAALEALRAFKESL